MRSPEELRKEARGLLERTRGFIDPAIRRELASRAFELAQLAGSIAELEGTAERCEPQIAQYRSMLKDPSLSQDQRRLIEDVLRESESIGTGKQDRRAN